MTEIIPHNLRIGMDGLIFFDPYNGTNFALNSNAGMASLRELGKLLRDLELIVELNTKYSIIDIQQAAYYAAVHQMYKNNYNRILEDIRRAGYNEDNLPPTSRLRSSYDTRKRELTSCLNSLSSEQREILTILVEANFFNLANSGPNELVRF